MCWCQEKEAACGGGDGVIPLKVVLVMCMKKISENCYIKIVQKMLQYAVNE